MFNGKPFIDIHTHHITTEQHVSILNIPAGNNWQDNLPSNIYISTGLHPWYSDNWQDKLKAVYNNAMNNKVIAIGECGLDKNTELPMNQQEEIFLKHIEISETLQKPVIIHCVKAFDELIKIRKKIKPQMPWIIHGFNKSVELGMQCIDHGFFLSFGKTLLTNTSATIPLIKILSTDKFFLETDESDVAISNIYQRCANIKNIPSEKLQEEIYKNFCKCFKIGNI